MPLLAVSGQIVIGVVVVCSVVLLLILLRGEDRYEAEQRKRRDG
jgi:hypothetical protein